MSYLNELEDLEDILHTIQYEDTPSNVTDNVDQDERIECVNTIVQLMYEYTMSNPNKSMIPTFTKK